MNLAVLDIPDVTTSAGLPKTYELAEVAEMIGYPVRRLRERANRKEFTHIRVSPQNLRMTAQMIRALLAQLTEEAASADPGVDRDRERVARQRNRAAAPKPRSRKAA
jgi:hypothetical protein